jgi:hypothetical protein
MKKRGWLIFGVIIFLIIAFIIGAIIFEARREKRINRFEFPSTMVVNNYTTHKRADTLAMVILNKIFEYDTIKLDIVYAPQNLSNSEYEIVGFIQQNPFEPHTYMVFVKKGNLPISIKNFLSHELIHLQQMEIGDLVQIDQTKIVYQNDTIYFSEVPYDKRPYERDAYSRENGVRKKLNELLYRK